MALAPSWSVSLGVPDLLPVGLRSVLASSQAFDSFRGFSSVCLSSAGPPDLVTAKNHFSCQVDSGGTTGRNLPTRIVRPRFLMFCATPSALFEVLAQENPRSGANVSKGWRLCSGLLLCWQPVFLYPDHFFRILRHRMDRTLAVCPLRTLIFFFSSSSFLLCASW